MKPLVTFFTPNHDCAYRPGETARLKYEVVESISPAEYEERMDAGWRRFGHALFTHVCPNCSACQPIRIDVNRFEPNRSQRRAWMANQDLTLTVAQPAVTAEKLELYDRYHLAQCERIGWPDHGPKNEASYFEGFVDQPFPVEEWLYRLGDRLVGVGYVDLLPASLSAIYFFHEPDLRERSLGTLNVLNVLAEAKRRQLPWVHLGYMVSGCRSLQYKGKFRPHELRTDDGTWQRESGG